MREGGKDSNSAWAAALLYAEKAMRMRGHWIHWNPMTERVDILYIKKRISTFVKSWELFREQEDKHSSPDPAAEPPAQGSIGGVASPETPCGKRKREVKQEVKQEPQPGNPSPGGKPAEGGGKKPKRKTEEEKKAEQANAALWKRAQLLKTLHLKVTATQASRMKSLQHDEAWACLSCPATITKLTELHESVQRIFDESGKFVGTFMQEEAADVRKAWKDDMQQFWFKIKCMLEALEKPLQALDAEHARLLRMFNASRE